MKTTAPKDAGPTLDAVLLTTISAIAHAICTIYTVCSVAEVAGNPTNAASASSVK